MTTHLPPLQVGATAGATYVGGSFPEADQSYYGHNSYPAPTSSYASQSASNGTSSSSPPSYGTDEGPAFSIGAGSVTSDGQHHTYRGQVYTANGQPRSPVSPNPNSWYQFQDSYRYPTPSDAAWATQTLQQTPIGDTQASQSYSGLPAAMNNHSDNFSPTSDSVSGDVNTYIQGQDVHDYQYQYQHQSPLNYQYDGQYPLPTHPTSSEYVSASTPEVVHHYQGVPDTLENQQHTLAQHRRSRPGEHQHAMAQRRPMSQTPFFEDSPINSPLEPSGNPQDFYPSPAMSSSSQTNAQHRRRSPSPMGHLPYPEDVQRGEGQGTWTNWSSPQSHGWNAYEQASSGHGTHPDMAHPQLANSSQPHFVMEGRRSRPMSTTSPCPPSHSASIRQINAPLSSLDQSQRRSTAPAPTRNPTLVEDTPKKPLTLACLFCRKRKIACGSPPPGQKDRTCNQCARRSLTCEYPVVSRRGMRPRASTDTDSGHGLFQIEVRP